MNFVYTYLYQFVLNNIRRKISMLKMIRYSFTIFNASLLFSMIIYVLLTKN